MRPTANFATVPPEAAHRRQRRWPWLIVAGVALLTIGVLVARSTLYRDRSRAVTADDALGAYRRDTASSSSTPATSPAGNPTTLERRPSEAAPRPALTQPGVYRYRTTGDESIDVAGGAHHAYPAETTITVTPDGCGIRLRWDALRERRDEWRLCPTAAGLTMPWALSYHEFFKQPDAEELVCPGDTLLLPADPQPGSTWDASCQLAGDDAPQHFDVVGWEGVAVEGRSVPTLHLRQSVDIGGYYYEHTVTDWWLTPDGLPVRATRTKTSRSSSPIGGVTYDEHYDVNLESLSPLH